MNKFLFRLLCAAMAVLLLIPVIPRAYAGTQGISLSQYIRNAEKRHFVESMLSYHLQANETVQKTLNDGYSAVFFFEGCSDNMEDPDLSDLSYYRVSAVCIALKLDEAGDPEIIYFNDDCSTLPDRPVEYGAWEIEAYGKVGPATVCDGTYELYSVYHAGSYEALHIRTNYEDATVSAVYLTPEGHVIHPATYINIHTRTGNHALETAMWSAGCLLVGDGRWYDFTNLVLATYYSNYEKFAIDQKVGCVTINRLQLQEQMYDLYGDEEAVDTLLVASRCERPEIYLEQCTSNTPMEEKLVQAAVKVDVMSLPCSNGVDARSIPVTRLNEGDKIDICGSIVNTKGQLWYEVSFFGENCYVPAGSVEEIQPPTFFQRLREFFSFS